MLTPLTARSIAAMPGIRHGFFTRIGGVSQGLYASLNCGLGSKDDRAAVAENRSRVAQSLGATGDRLLTCHQVHSATAIVVDRPWTFDTMPRADAIVTRTRGLAVAALAADCTPILFADPIGRVVGAAHAGWKGALSDVLASTVAAMEGLGSRRSDIRAAIGPTISPSNYEVGREFETQFLEVDPAFARFFVRRPGHGKPHFDLPGFVAFRLAQLSLGGMERADRCTYGRESDFFSFRRTTHRQEGDYGRQISAIVVA